MARCPAHEDKNPSLSLRDGDGKVLVHCFGGCPQDAVIAALKDLGLWPERERRTFSRADRVAWGAARRVQSDAFYFARALRALCCTLLENVDHPARIAVADLTRDLKAVPMSTYLEWRDHEPQITRGLVLAGRSSAARFERRLAAWFRMERHAS